MRSLNPGDLVSRAAMPLGSRLLIGLCTSAIAPLTTAVPEGLVFKPTLREMAPVM